MALGIVSRSFHRGKPGVLTSIDGMPVLTMPKKAWFVDGNLTGGDGTSWETAFSTIQAAVNAAAAYDVIYIKPFAPSATQNNGQPQVYAENITIAVGKTGLKLIGVPDLSDPYFGPKIKPANTAAHVIHIDAASVTLENLCIHNQALSTAGVFLSWMGATYNVSPTVDASHVLYAGSCGFNIRNCEFREGTTMATAGASIVVRGGFNGVIENCTFVAGANAQAIQLGDDITTFRNHKVINCNFHDNNGAAATNYITVGTGANKGIVIRDCTFGNATKFIIVPTGATSGIIAGCYFQDTVATLANSTGKVQTPSGQDVAVTGCWGGVSLAVIQSAA